jgi:NADPH-dependent 2,4-dienoyl-CoA reductase/sulfur reductase-like enzyme/nitrite reductase/ring-hydroxylating ferredoxin subunit
MAQEQAPPSGPDLTQGVAPADFADGKLVGHVGADSVLLVQTDSGIFAVAALCSHYHAPLADGIVVGNSVRCPWHHARFDLKSGEAVCPPAWNALDCWNVEQRDGRIFVKEKRVPTKPPVRFQAPAPEKIVIVGGGAAGFAAAEMLRRQGYGGSVVMLSQEAARPVDRPNLSKDNLAGTAPEDWLFLEPSEFYAKNDIDLRLDTEVLSIDTGAREIAVAGGERLSYDRLLLATGAEPVRLAIPGADQPHVHTLRALPDCRAIIAGAKEARRALVIGASFIGMEAAASLRARGLEVHVVAPGERPLERVLGPQIGDFVRALHEEHGVVFHLQDSVTALDGPRATLKSGGSIEVDLVVAGIGVRPRLALAEKAGLKTDRGVVVDRYLQTSARDVFAAGDIARWPDPHSGENIRVEHWVVAQRQGQTAARNMLGLNEPFEAVPFFWSQHYDVAINYVGHAEQWDEIQSDGDIKAKDCLLRYKKSGRVLAVASIFRDAENLRAELALEHGLAASG